MRSGASREQITERSDGLKIKQKKARRCEMSQQRGRMHANAAGTWANSSFNYRPPNVLAHRGELSAKEARPGGAMGLP